MEYRTLGKSDLNVSVIGVGTMSWPYCAFAEEKPAAAQVDRAAVADIVNTAIELGVNLFDTAEGYGRGFSEQLLGEALKTLGKRDQVLVCTKVGRPGESVRESCDLTAANIQRRCEASLARLRMDHVDLYLAHRPDPSTPPEETVAAFERLREQGKIRYFGISEFDPRQMTEVLKHGTPVANQLAYSLVERRIDIETRQFCASHNIGIMVFSPLAKGLLSGKYNKDHLPPPVDDRRDHHFKPQTLDQFFAVADAVRDIGAELGVTPSKVALAWCLAQPGITTLLPGAKTAAQLQESASAASLKLPPDVLARLNAISVAPRREL
jgi:aryl-alcohol dehydrogenase-like predicted oxidoreductase